MTDDLERLVALAIRRRDGDIDELTAITGESPELLTPHLPALLAAGVDYPAALYSAADAEVRRELVARVDAGPGDLLALDHLLKALALTSGPESGDAFLRWRDAPPPGAEKLHVPVAFYLNFGGRALDGDATRDLCGPVAYVLDVEEGAVVPEGVRCGDCDGPLWTALDLDTAEPAVAEALAHTGWSGRLRVDLCHRCDFTADVVFRDVAPDGTSTRSPHTPPGAGAESDPPTHRLVPGERSPARRPDVAAVGGLPEWTDDPRYPACPNCSATMDYVAQIELGDPWDSYLDGYLTFFLHTECRLAAALCQG
ncbi:hypothetical protein AB0I28_06095 [Phytomonospora sp. NPDC050363]|uniref:hypothetical protein n=1 Tax=Phytomonospora sp. NPDC050363 TaxID=3155642 RepID=UPI0033C55140